MEHTDLCLLWAAPEGLPSNTDWLEFFIIKEIFKWLKGRVWCSGKRVWNCNTSVVNSSPIKTSIVSLMSLHSTGCFQQQIQGEFARAKIACFKIKVK